MKNPETPSPSPSSRSYLPRIVDPVEVEVEDKFQPRYVEVPALRQRGFGRRNLAWGVIMLVLAIALLVAAVIVSGQKAVLSLAACLLTFTALYVLSRMHVFRQRNGSFLAVSIVVLLGAIVPLIDRGYEKLAGVSHPAPGNQQQMGPGSRPPENETPLLRDAFALTKPEPTQTQVRVLKDSRVTIENKPFLIKAGDTFPLLAMREGKATFAVRDLQVALSVDLVEISGGKPGGRVMRETKESAIAAALAAVSPDDMTSPASEPSSNLAPESVKPMTPTTPAAPTAPATPAADLAAITRTAQLEAVHRYPALGVKDSIENEAFVTTFRQLKTNGDVQFFSNPEWPLVLAELLASRNGWTRGDVAAEPAPILDPPTPAPMAEPAEPGPDDVLMNVPQQLPPPSAPKPPRTKR